MADLRFFYHFISFVSTWQCTVLYIDLLCDLFLSFSHCDRTESSSFRNYRSIFEKGYKKNRMLFFIRKMNFARNKVDTCCSLYEFQRIRSRGRWKLVDDWKTKYWKIRFTRCSSNLIFVLRFVNLCKYMYGCISEMKITIQTNCTDINSIWKRKKGSRVRNI